MRLQRGHKITQIERRRIFNSMVDAESLYVEDPEKHKEMYKQMEAKKKEPKRRAKRKRENVSIKSGQTLTSRDDHSDEKGFGSHKKTKLIRVHIRSPVKIKTK